MNTKVILALVLTVVLVGAGNGAMVLIDRQIDLALVQLERGVTEPLTVTTVDDVSRLTSRDLTLKIGLNTVDTPVSILFNNVIQKRPWGATIEHALTVDPSIMVSIADTDTVNLLEKYLVEQSVITGSTQISPTGKFSTALTSVSVDDQTKNMALVVHPIDMEANGHISGSIVFEGSWQGMAVTINDLEDTNLQIKPVEFFVDGEYEEDIIFVGEQTLNGQGAEFKIDSQWQNVQGNLGEYSFFTSANLVDNKYRADMELNLERFGTDDGESVFELSDLNLVSSVSGIEADNYRNLVMAANKLQGSAEPSDALITAANQLIKNGFEISISSLSVKLNNLPVALSFSINIPKNQVANVANPYSLLGLFGSVSASAHIELDQNLAEISQVSEMVNGMLMSGAFIEDGSNFKMDFNLEKGQPSLNGEILSLPF